TGLAHYHAQPNSLRVGQKFIEADNWHCQLMGAAKGGTAVGIAVSGFVHPLDQITGLLEFEREKVGSRDINTLRVDALLVCAAGSDLVGPKRQAAGVSLPVQEIVIVLAYKVLRVINDVGRRLGWIVGNLDGSDCGCAQTGA